MEKELECFCGCIYKINNGTVIYSRRCEDFNKLKRCVCKDRWAKL